VNSLLQRNLSAYLDRATGLKVDLVPSSLAKIPFFLRGRYDLAEGELYGHRYAFFAPRRDFDDWTPAKIESDRDQLAKILQRPPIFVPENIRPNQRQRLIQKRIPFISPGTQMYLPELLIDLREHFARERSKPVETLSPSAQHLLLMAFEQRQARFETALNAAEMVKYSAMTVGRAMEELAAIGLARIVRKGRTKSLAFEAQNEAVEWRSLWQRASPHLRSPVRRTFPLSDCPPELLASAKLSGLTALAHYSMLNEPKTKVWAISPEWYQNHAVALENVEAPGADWGHETLEIWSYDPALSATQENSWIRGSKSVKSGIVDRLSLYLALRGTEDERIEQALEQMIEEISW
jgi:hypothetical protein